MLKTRKPLRRDLAPRDRKPAPWKQLPPKGKVDTSALPYGVVPRVRAAKPHEPRARTRCEVCGIEIRRQGPHHLIPRSLGGPDHPYNLMMLCGPRAAWGCHRDAQEGRLSREYLAEIHARLFPEIQNGEHLLEEIRKRMLRIKRGVTDESGGA